MFETVELSRPITVPETGSRTIRLAALVRAPGEVEIVLRSDETAFQADHFRATCRYVDVESELDKHVDALDELEHAALPIDPQTDLYGEILFHRGWFRRVHGYRQLSATRCIAELTPEGRSRWFTGYLPERLLLGDPAVRDATIHAIQACIPHGTILPTGIDRLVPNTRIHAEPLFVHAREREHTGDRFVYDVVVTTADGQVCEHWEGLRLQRVGQPVSLGHWIEPLLGPYFERRLAELVPGAAATLAVLQNGRNGGGSESPIAAALGDSVPIFHRTDGKPIAVCEREVSVAHTDKLTMTIAGRGPVACDAEPVAPRTAREWHDLLGNERNVLAEWIAGNSNDDFGAAASRLWSAGECLKKAGLPIDAPLVVRESTADGWIVLGAGQTSIATWVGPVGASARPLAVAMLVGSADAKL